MTSKTHYSVTELAEMMKVSTARVRQLIGEERIPGAVKMAGVWLIPVGDAHKFLAQYQAGQLDERQS